MRKHRTLGFVYDEEPVVAPHAEHVRSDDDHGSNVVAAVFLTGLGLLLLRSLLR